MADNFLIIDAKALLSPKCETAPASGLDLRQRKGYFQYAIGYSRILSDLVNKCGYKLILIKPESTQISELEQVFIRCGSLGSPVPNVHASYESKEKLPATLRAKLKKRDNQHFVFCDNLFDYAGTNAKSNANWSGKAFFDALANIYQNVQHSPERVFARLAQYGEYFVDDAGPLNGKYLNSRNLPQNVTSKEVMATIDNVASALKPPRSNLWWAADSVRKLTQRTDPVFDAKKIIEVDVQELEQYKPKGFSKFRVLRTMWEKEYHANKSRRIDAFISALIPIYRDKLGVLLGYLDQKAAYYRKEGYVRSASVTQDLQQQLSRKIPWFFEHYARSSDPYVKFFGLLECVEECLHAAERAQKKCINDKLKAHHVVGNVVRLLLATLTVLPLVIYSIYFGVQRRKNSRYHFMWHPENEYIKMCREAERVVSMPTKAEKLGLC